MQDHAGRGEPGDGGGGGGRIADRQRPLDPLVSLAALPGATVLHRLGIRTDVQHTNVTGSIAAWRGYKRGLWEAGHTTARKPEA